jgi:hypothetical protein
MKRHHWLIVGAAAVFLVGWLLWNVVLVEQDVASPAGGSAATPGPH